MTSIKVEQSQDKTLEELVSEANTIFEDAKAFVFEAMSLQQKEHQGNKLVLPPKVVGDVISRLHQKYKDFCSTYPIVVRYMVQYGNYNPKVFSKYIKKVMYHPWKNTEDFIQSQCDYVMILYRETMSSRGKRYDKKEAMSMRDDVYKSLKAELTMFQTAVEKASKKVEEQDETLRKSKKDDLVNYIKSLK